MRFTLNSMVAVLLWLAVSLLSACGPGNGPRDAASPAAAEAGRGDPLAAIQAEAANSGRSPYFHWGGDPDVYAGFDGHSNRLVPVWVHGARPGGDVDLKRYAGERSAYRDASALRKLYGRVPDATLDSDAVYLDQTDVFRLQRDALAAGRNYIFLVVMDGLDWQTLQLAASLRGADPAAGGPGDALVFQRPGPSRPVQFGFAVTSPYGRAGRLDVDAQSVGPVTATGGYDAARGGATPWDPAGGFDYLSGRDGHAVADSAASAVAMTAGEKTFNGAINRGPGGASLTTLAHLAQRRGMAVGTVTSVPFNHATTAAAYARNVSRDDYQDLARDMLGLPSVSHPDQALGGLDVVLGAGHGLERRYDAQGRNFEPGNRYIAPSDLARIDALRGGRYRVVRRESGTDGTRRLQAAAADARDRGLRLFGLFGTRYGHLPFATANGDFEPVADGDGEAETYDEATLRENPTLAEMTGAALTVLQTNPAGFWLLVEQGDVDWANHDNNVDNAAGAVFSGERAIERIMGWVEANSDWRESLLIVTADHGHMLFWDDAAAFEARVAGDDNDDTVETP